MSLPLPDQSTLAEWVSKGLITPEAAGLKPVEKKVDKSPAASMDKARARVTLRVEISPLRLVSEANAGGKLRAKISRKTAVKDAVWKALELVKPVPLPCVVVLVRTGGKELDKEENLPMSLKAVKDVVAEWLGLPNDRDGRVRWMMRQRADYKQGCEIVIRSDQ